MVSCFFCLLFCYIYIYLSSYTLTIIGLVATICDMEVICGGSAYHSLTNHLKTPCEIEWYEGVLHSRNQRRYHLIRHCYYPSPSVPSKCFVRGYDVKFVQSAFDEYTRPPCSCRTACRGNTWTNPWRKRSVSLFICKLRSVEVEVFVSQKKFWNNRFP